MNVLMTKEDTSLSTVPKRSSLHKKDQPPIPSRYSKRQELDQSHMSLKSDLPSKRGLVSLVACKSKWQDRPTEEEAPPSKPHYPISVTIFLL